MKLWIARDKDGTLLLSDKLPYLPNKDYTFFCFGDGVSIYNLDRNMFPEVTFENSPQQVEIKLVNEIVGVAESPSKTFQRVNEFDVGASYRR